MWVRERYRANVSSPASCLPPPSTLPVPLHTEGAATTWTANPPLPREKGGTHVSSSLMTPGGITLETKFSEGELRTTGVKTGERMKMVTEWKRRNYSSYWDSLRISLWVLRAGADCKQ